MSASIKNADNREERPFSHDATTHGGYLYTKQQPLSAKLAIGRQTAEVLRLFDFTDKRVLDVGCGDGTTTIDLFDKAQPQYIEAFDPAASAIEIAASGTAGRPIRFSVGSAYEIPHPDGSFDIAHLRGVLHHMNRPDLAVAEAARVARTVIILEPNGLNPVLKVIEKVSPYHRAHGERSFPPALIRRWMRSAGLKIASDGYCCLVPYFCPDSLARMLNAIEPAIEKVPWVRQISCGAYTVVGEH